MGIVRKTIGTGVGRDYATIQAWVTATTYNLVTAGNIEIGEVYDDSGLGFTITNGNARINLSGATTNQFFYRLLTAGGGGTPPDGGDHVNPVNLTGVRLYVHGGSSSANGDGIILGEPYAKVRGIGIIQITPPAGTDPTTGESCGIRFKAGALNCKTDQMYVSWTKGSGSYVGYGVKIEAGNNHQLLNTIAQGSDVDGEGASFGLYAFLVETIDMYNCSVYSIRGGVGASDGIGLTNRFGGSIKRTINCISSGCRTKDFDVQVTPNRQLVRNCISGDNTASVGDDSFTNVVPADLWINPRYADFRNKQNSVAIDAGLTLPWAFGTDNTAKTRDFTGAVRTAPWEIGAYQGGTPTPPNDPTVIVKSIGSAGGRDYATIQAFLNASAKHLVAANEQWIGELYDDSIFNQGTTTLEVKDAVADATRNRVLRAASGHRWSPFNGIGARIDGSHASNPVLKIIEDYFRLEGVRVKATGAIGASCVEIRANYVVNDSVVAENKTASTAGRGWWHSSGRDCDFLNCIALGATGGVGLQWGFDSARPGDRFFNCVAYAVTNTAGTGFKAQEATQEVRNCIAASCTIDFSLHANLAVSNCISSDATAAGPGSSINQGAGVVFFDAAANDFRLIFSSPAVNAGVNLSAVFSTDFDGAARSVPWEIGAFDGFAGVAFDLFAQPHFGACTRAATCWRIERLDGVSLYFTDHNRVLTIKGENYLPISGFDASARQRQGAMREQNVDFVGVISSAAITLADLMAGRYRGARVTEMLVDWRYPFATPYYETTYVVMDTTQDSELWHAQVDGLPALLQTGEGELYLRTCPYELGSRKREADCNKDIAADTQNNKPVTTVVDARRSFTTGTGDISASYADGFFVPGKLTWLSGANQGRISYVRVYTQATRTFELFDPLPFDIQVGDDFTVEPGCDGLPATCKTKFNNYVNFGGYEFIPGTNKTMETPQR